MVRLELPKSKIISYFQTTETYFNQRQVKIRSRAATFCHPKLQPARKLVLVHLQEKPKLVLAQSKIQRMNVVTSHLFHYFWENLSVSFIIISTAQ